MNMDLASKNQPEDCKEGKQKGRRILSMTLRMMTGLSQNLLSLFLVFDSLRLRRNRLSIYQTSAVDVLPSSDLQNSRQA